MEYVFEPEMRHSSRGCMRDEGNETGFDSRLTNRLDGQEGPKQISGPNIGPRAAGLETDFGPALLQWKPVLSSQVLELSYFVQTKDRNW